jgi:hypothetical protein
MATLFFLTITILLINLVYHQITTLIDLYPFNNIRGVASREKLVESSVNGFTMLFPVIALVSGNRILMNIAVILLTLVCIGEFFTWYYPYLFGSTSYWQKIYDQKFKKTIIVLPSIKNHPIPNLEHMILHFLTLTAFILTAVLVYSAQ